MSLRNLSGSLGRSRVTVRPAPVAIVGIASGAFVLPVALALWAAQAVEMRNKKWHHRLKSGVEDIAIIT